MVRHVAPCVLCVLPVVMSHIMSARHADEALWEAISAHRFDDADALLQSEPLKGYCAASPPGKPFKTWEVGPDWEHPLVWAVSLGDARVVEYLLDRGADPNVWDCGSEMSPFHFLCWQCDDTTYVDTHTATVIFDLMLRHGADPHKPVYDGSTPAGYLADHAKDSACAQAMLDALVGTGEPSPEPEQGPTRGAPLGLVPVLYENAVCMS